MDLSIIIVSFNTKGLLEACLRSILESSELLVVKDQNESTKLSNLCAEITVVDNGSRDGSVEMVEREFKSVRPIKNLQNLGFSAANNQGVKASQGRYIFLLNSDVTLQPSSISSMVQFIEQDLQIGILGPRLINPSGSLQPSGRKFPSLWREVFYYSSLWSRIPRFFSRLFDFGPTRDFSKAQEVDEVSGAAMLVRREVIDKIGFLDERFFMYYEDTDFCLRAKEAGFKVVYYPAVTIVHHQAESAKKVATEANRWLWQSAHRYSQKWRKPWEVWLLKQLFKLKGFRFEEELKA